MRNFTRFLSLVLSIIMLCGMITVSVGAAEAGDYSDAAKRLSAVGILKGDGRGNLSLNATVKRWQTALFFTQIMTGITEADKLNAVKSSDYFSDVTEYGTAIDMAYGYGVVKGHGDGTYGYNDNIIYQDMLVMAVRALGYETEGMVYPFGHIIEADTLGITENMEKGLAYNKPLTRGETAQIIWNTLNIDIAVKNPSTGKPVHPDASDPARQTYLEKSKFTQGKIEGVIVDYTPAVKSSDVDTVTVKINGHNEIFRAEDLDLEGMLKSDFLNLPVTLYVNYKTADEFFANYDYNEKENKGKIVIFEYPEFDFASNIGDEGNIKYVAPTGKAAYLELNGEKYATDKYNFDVRMLDKEDGWKAVDPMEQKLEHAFLYETKNGYIGSNSYGEVQFTVIPSKIEDENPTLLILYTPYAFGRYASREIKYEAEGVKTNIVTIATYESSVGSYKNFDGHDTNFVEYTLGENGVKVENGMKSISVTGGKTSYNVIVDDQFGCANNDYVFYCYNELDNVLKIAYNFGPTKSGVLSGYNEKDRSIKIDNTNYKFGFPGSFETNLPQYTSTNPNSSDNFGKHFKDIIIKTNDERANLYYVAIGDNVIYAKRKTYNDSDVAPYVIATLDKETICEAMDITAEEFTEQAVLINGKEVLIDGNGIVVARLDTASGEWGTDKVLAVAYYNSASGVKTYDRQVSLATHVKALNMFGTDADYVNKAALRELIDVIDNGILILYEDSADGMTVASVPTTSVYNDHKDIIDYFTMTSGNGITVSDTGAKTNKMKATNIGDSVSTARKTLTSKSVLVVVDKNGTVGVRRGATDSSASINKTVLGVESFPCNFYTTTNSLIVMHAFETDLSTFFTTWEKGDAETADEAYFVVTKDSELEYEVNDDDTFTIKISNAFNLVDLANDNLSVDVDDITSSAATNLINNFAAGKIIHRSADNKITICSETTEKAFLDSVNLADDKDETFYKVDLSTLDFADFESISVTLKNGNSTVLSLAKDDAVASINVKLATVDTTSFNSDEYDYTEIALDKTKFDPAGVAASKYTNEVISTVKFNDDGAKYYAYSILRRSNIVDITEPASGIFDNYIINTNGAKLHIAENDDVLFEDAAEICVNLYVCGRFDKDTGILELQVLKVIADAQ